MDWLLEKLLIGLLAALAVLLLLLIVLVPVAILAGPSPSKINRDAIEQCQLHKGTVVIDRYGYLDRCIIGPAPVVIGGK